MRCRCERLRLWSGCGFLFFAFCTILLLRYYHRTISKVVRHAETVFLNGDFIQTIRSRDKLADEITGLTVLTEVVPQRTHIYSAFVVMNELNLTKISGTYRYTNNTSSTIILTGWEHKVMANASYKCCLWLTEDTVVELTDSHKKYRKGLRATLQATEFRCPLTVSSSEIKHVYMTLDSVKCPNEIKFYLRPFFSPLKQIPGLAICNKIAYFEVNPSFLVEWLEIQRFLGVSKVLVYPYELNADAMNVLKFYSSIDFVDILMFDYPGKDIVPRKAGTKNYQCFNDESVTVYDCQERLRHFKYAVVLDKDELIFPFSNGFQGSLIKYLKLEQEHQVVDQPTGALFQVEWSIFQDEELGKKHDRAAIRFRTQYHDIEFQPNGMADNNSMITARATKCSSAKIDRPKNIYMPERVVPGSVSTHALTCLPGYGKIVSDSATIHHYRRARPKQNKDIYSENCDEVGQLARMVANSVANVRKELGLSKKKIVI